MDTGLAGYLTEWSSPETLEPGAMSGATLETVCEPKHALWLFNSLRLLCVLAAPYGSQKPCRLVLA